jgi:hypothetical protein
VCSKGSHSPGRFRYLVYAGSASNAKELDIEGGHLRLDGKLNEHSVFPSRLVCHHLQGLEPTHVSVRAEPKGVRIEACFSIACARYIILDIPKFTNCR